MPSTEETPKPRRSRQLPVTIDPLAKALIDVIDDQHDGLLGEVRSFRRLTAAAAGGLLLIFGIQAATTVYLISGLLATRGVDVGDAADATKKVVGAGVDAAQVVTESADGSSEGQE